MVQLLYGLGDMIIRIKIHVKIIHLYEKAHLKLHH